ncbi:MAG: Amidohydrolase [Paenibacillus sp.]|nr:Amidohydrolase [Paenibacillus sp.]
MYTDVNVLLGQWPFRKIYKNTLEDLRKVHSDNRITGGYAASLNSVFYNDPFEGDEELHEQIKGTEYKHILTVNPDLPGWERDIEEGIRRFDIHGVRVYPCYHPFDLNGEAMSRLSEVLIKHDLPLFISKRMEDERLDYLLQQLPLAVDKLQQFIVSKPNLKIVLLTVRIGEIETMKDEILAHPHVYMDTSGLKDRVFVIEDLLKTIPVERVLYGSNHPLFTLKSSFLLVEMAAIEQSIKEQIWGSNADVLKRK